MSKKTLLAVCIAASMSGCATIAPGGVCRSDSRIDIPEAGVAISTSKSQKAVVLPVDVASNINNAELVSKAFQIRLESQVDVSGTKLVDRSLVSDKLKKEIQFAEQSGRINTSGVAIADYAILAEVTSSTLDYSFTDEKTETDDDGEEHYTPASCRFTGKVEGLVKVVELPSQEVVSRIELKGKESSSFKQKRPDSSCPISNMQYQRLIEEAAKNAVNRNDDLKNALAPSGVIKELRQCEEFGTMVKVDMGANQGIHPKQKMIISYVEEVNNEDGKPEVETYTVTEGLVATEDAHSGIKPSYSWVGIEPAKVSQIQRGGLVEAHFDSGCNELPEFMQDSCWELYESWNKK